MTNPDGAPEGAPGVGDQAQDPAASATDWRRLHPLTPLLRGGLVLIVIGGILLANFRDHLLGLFIAEEYLNALGPSEGDLIDFIVGESLIVVALLAVLGAIALIVFISWLSWRFHTFRITAEAVEERSGIVFRQHRRAPLDRIQSVNLQRPLLARVLGLTAVDVQTGGQGGRVSLRYLGHRDAKDVRERILLEVAARRGGPTADRSAPSGTARPGIAPLATAPSATAPSETAPFETAPSGAAAPPEAASAAAPRDGAPVVAQFDERIRDLADFDIDPAARESGSLVRVPIGRLIASILLGSEMLVIVLIAAGILVVSIWFSPFLLVSVLPLALVLIGLLVGQFNRGFNFVLSRSSDGIRVGAGLTSTTTETVPFGRIHAVEARQPIGWRPFGWWKVRITTAGHAVAQGGQNRLQNTVLPVGRVEDVLRVFETLLPGSPSPERAEELRAALLGPVDGYLGAGPGAAWVLWFGRRRAGLRLDDAGGHPTLRIRRGAVTRSLGVLPIVRAQSVQLRRPMVHRMLGLASVQAHTVLGPVQMEMRGLGLDQARRVFETLARTIVRVQSEESDQRSGAPILDPSAETGEAR